ncbi:DUF6931 family protein [Pseudooceanicola sp. C21-150M6]|uniref:DUF6931 family protein n=1 Tax=Pseudooceanicola sp. C21-150M6 TaxID=3434355 RepID=UPI003D7FA891
MELDLTDMRKLPSEPYTRVMARVGVKLSTKLDLPASATVEEALQRLSDLDEPYDFLHLLAMALPTREAVWWACLAAGDLMQDPDLSATPSMIAAKGWVFNPDDQHRAAAQTAFEGADPNDNTRFCAMAAFYGDGTLGMGDLSREAAPPAAVSSAVLAQVMLTLGQSPHGLDSDLDLAIRRVIDIARGGNGRVSRGLLTEDQPDEQEMT